MNEKLTLRLSGGPTAPARARTALRSLDRSLCDLREDVDLLVSELVTNSVRHAHAKRIEVTACSAPAGVRVEVSDGGPGFEPKAVRRNPAGPGEAGGYGLFLVERLANRWGIERNRHSRVWFEIDRTDPERRSAPVPARSSASPPEGRRVPLGPT